MIKCIGLTFGFAEEQHPWLMVLTHPQGFKTKKEAIENLASNLFNKFYVNRSLKRSCCLKNLTSNFCPECGVRLDHWNISPEEFEDWLRDNIIKTSADRFWSNWEEEWEIIGDLLEIIKFKSSEIVNISYYAERVLTAAIPDLLISETVLEEFKLYRQTAFFDNQEKKMLKC